MRQNTFTCTTLALICSFGVFVHSDVPRPRGVALSKASLYEPSDTFVCLDGKKTIKYTQVNDDYCDCADASDEPGTAACPTGTFHCSNAGYKPKNIPSSRVNDGICDCCDASDEYQSDAQCINNCSELGKEDRAREKHKAELAKMGNQLRTEMAAKGKTMKAEHRSRLDELKKSHAEAEALTNEREEIKKEAESLEAAALETYRDVQDAEKRDRMEREALENSREAQEIFAKYDSNGNGVLEIAEIQTRIAFDKNRDGEVSVEEAKYFLEELEEVNFETFKTLSWPRVKPFLMMDSGLFKPPADVQDLDIDRNDEERADDDVAHQLDEEVDHTDEDGTEEEEYEEETGEGEVESVDTEREAAAKIEYDPDTQLLIEQANGARNLFLEADRELREIKAEISRLEELLDKDFGPNEEFAPLSGECFNFEDREYVYKVCPFDKAIQQAKAGGSETRLGGWDRWNGKVNKYATMLFSNGAACWNGPQRSATVHLECGMETKITSVSEPNRCEYVYTMQTPSACVVNNSTDNETTKDTHSDHDEL